MNWETKSIEKLEDLPKQERLLPPDDGWDRYHGQNFPNRRLTKWLRANVGNHIDDVFSKFVNLDWIDREYRNLNKFKKYVEIDTFVQDGEICFYDDHLMYRGRGRGYEVLKDRVGDILYINPKSRHLQRHIKRARFNAVNQHNLELAKRVRILWDYQQIVKIDGIWFFIKGAPLPKTSLGWGLDRKGPREPMLEKNSKFRNMDLKIPFVKIVMKRQLSREELRKYRVRND